MGTPSFSTMFSKGDNMCDFLVVYLADEVFSKCGLLLLERICFHVRKFLPFRFSLVGQCLIYCATGAPRRWKAVQCMELSYFV